MSLSYAGVPLMAPLDGLQELIDVHGGLKEIAAFQMPSWTGLNGRLADYGPSREGKLGCLLWPVGASRWAQGHFVATQSQLDAIKKAIPISPSGSTAAPAATLKIWDEEDASGATTVETEMYLLSPWPLFNHDDADTDIERLWLLTFVDVRYFWWHKPAEIFSIAGVTSWADIVQSIMTALEVDDYTLEDVDTKYLRPHTSLSSPWDYLPPLLDAVAYSIGRRVVRKLDGSVELQKPQDGRSVSMDLLAEWREWTLQGGSMAIGDDGEKAADIDLWATAPASVTMSFPQRDIRQTGEGAATTFTVYRYNFTDPCDPIESSSIVQVGTCCEDDLFTQMTANLADLSPRITEYRSQTQRPGSHLVRNTAVRWMDGDTAQNDTQLTNLLNQWAKDWYRWQLADQYRMYPTIVPWEGTGMAEFVEWQAWPKLATRVTRPPLNDMANRSYQYTKIEGVAPYPPTGQVPARLDTAIDNAGVKEYGWTEMEWDADTNDIAVKTDGMVGTLTPDRAWPASELNNLSITTGTIVWMSVGFTPADPARVSITKTAEGDGVAVKDAFSLYVDAAFGGTYSVVWDDIATADIAWNATSATVKSELETASGLTLTSFSGAGTKASPWAFTISSSDFDSHEVTPDGSSLKDGSGFRFDSGSAGGSQGFQGAVGDRGFQGFQSSAAGPQGFRGFQGFQGNRGFQGFTGNFGSVGSTWQTISITDIGAPSSGLFSINSATPSSVTGIRVFQTDSTGANLSVFLDTILVNDTIRVAPPVGTSSTPFVVAKITAIVKTTGSGVSDYTFTVTGASGTGTFTLGTVYGIWFGPSGFQGFQGSQGFQGLRGFQGFQGDVGVGGGSQGFQGFQGSTGAGGGAQGFQGAAGAQGFQGFQGLGIQGFQGFQGNTGAGGGAQGFQGFQGDVGANGPQGFQGFQGFQGSVGAGGGAQGFQGSTGAGGGAQGFQGSQGFQGFQGIVGDRGFQGFQGFQGEVGPGGGAQGFQGFQGNTGAGGGAQGFQGDIGSQGFQGFQGAVGSQGAVGGQGFQGFQSSVAGPQGFQGFQGSTGRFGGIGSTWTMSSVTSGIPSAGQISINSATASAVSVIRVNATDSNSVNLAGFLSAIAVGDLVCLAPPAGNPVAFVNAPVISVGESAGLYTFTLDTVLLGSVGTFAVSTIYGLFLSKRGPIGVQGFQGIGNQGFQGSQGFQGIAGSQGFQGLGNQGFQGIAGSQGSQGFQGQVGSQGFQGSAGVGSQGFQGFQGIAGAQGSLGSTAMIKWTCNTVGSLNGNTDAVTGTFALFTSDAATIGNSHPSSAFYMNPVDANGTNHTTIISGLAAGDFVHIAPISGNGLPEVFARIGAIFFANPAYDISLIGAGSGTFVAGTTYGFWFSKNGSGSGGSGAQGFQGFQGSGGSAGSQGFQGNRGFQGDSGVGGGSQGFQGAQGFQGNVGDFGGIGSIWFFQDASSGTPPIQYFTTNSATASSITTLKIHKQDFTNSDWTNIIGALAVGDRIRMAPFKGPSYAPYAVLRVTGLSLASSVYTITCTNLVGTGTFLLSPVTGYGIWFQERGAIEDKEFTIYKYDFTDPCDPQQTQRTMRVVGGSWATSDAGFS